MFTCSNIPDCRLVQGDTLAENEFLPTQWMCSNSSQGCSDAADNDISGIGIVVSFMLASALTFLAAVIGYGLSCVGHDVANELDRRILDKFKTWFVPRRFRGRGSAKWVAFFRKSIIMLSDQQLITGIAVLAAGFSQRCTINMYHFNIVIYLGWLSSGTHLITMACLREYFKANPALFYWRLIGVIALFVLLVSAITINASSLHMPSPNAVHYYWDTPARCAWNAKDLSHWADDSTLSLTFVLFNYTIRGMKLFTAGSKMLKRWSRIRTGSFLRSFLDKLWAKSVSKHTRISSATMAYWWLFSIYVHLHAIAEIYESFMMELAVLGWTLLWGYFKVFAVRSISKVSQYENEWGFGQYVAILLLLLPIMTTLENYHETKVELKEGTESEEGTDDAGSTKANTKVTSAVPGPSSPAASLLQFHDTIQDHMSGQTTGNKVPSPIVGPSTPTDSLLQFSNTIQIHTMFSQTADIPPHLRTFYSSKWYRLVIVGWVSFFALPFVILFIALVAATLENTYNSDVYSVILGIGLSLCTLALVFFGPLSSLIGIWKSSLWKEKQGRKYTKRVLTQLEDEPKAAQTSHKSHVPGRATTV